MPSTPVFENPWRFESNPEVYLLVAFLIGAYVYSIRVLGPKAVVGTDMVVAKRSNKLAFTGAMMLLFAASTWPIHQISEQYLYSAHMLQHMMLSYFMPPLVLLATPEWLFRVLVGNGRAYRILGFFCRPIQAALIFNAVVMITHIPGMVNASTTNPLLHYSLHLTLVITALGMWMPILGPFPEWHMSDAAKPIYLFLQSVVPTVPAGWLTFAEGVVYKRYNQPVRIWNISVIDDQQLAGAIMKIGGSVFLWCFVVFYFFKRFAPNWKEENTYRRAPLTYDQVHQAFQQSDAPIESQATASRE